MIAPHFERLATEHKDAIFIKVDVDDASDVASDQEISAMPTFKFFKNKVQVFSMSGANLEKLQQKVAELK